MTPLETLLTKYEKQEISRENFLWQLQVEIELAAARMLDEMKVKNEIRND